MTTPAYPAPMPMSPEARNATLQQAIAAEVARGKRVETQTEFQAVLVKGKRVNHVLHVILAVITCGFWFLVWPFVAMFGGEKRTVLTVDDYGHLLRK